ncbi:4-coumaroyl-homoserine lactone synthase [Alphaproteobacteria bacterium SO-S41]|nr:4-coumaroyl-homoserine lactone synthase [Alphaproteobacteria bacterium SO-S41]
MVLVVHAGNRHRYERELDSMFRDRKTVFVDLAKWKGLTADGDHEHDQFDTDAAVYLIAAEPGTGRHLSSLRLLPTTGPNLLTDVFPHLCAGALPAADDVWEVTRICFAPHLRGGARKEVFKLIALAAAEVGLVYGLRQYSVMAYLSFLPEVLAMGWDHAPLGVPQQVDERDPVVAFTLTIDSETLRKFRTQWGVRAPVLHLDTYEAA